MDLANQQRVKDAAEKFGADNVIVVLGSSDAEGAGIYAETVTAGDPTFAGPLSGVALGLPVYHIFEDAIRAEADPAEWENQISMMEMVLNTEALAQAVAEMRNEHGKSVL
jgi:betaine reductase